jgi:hypothetical protein
LGFELNRTSLEEFADFRKGGKRGTFPGRNHLGRLGKIIPENLMNFGFNEQIHVFEV